MEKEVTEAFKQRHESLMNDLIDTDTLEQRIFLLGRLEEVKIGMADAIQVIRKSLNKRGGTNYEDHWKK